MPLLMRSGDLMRPWIWSPRAPQGPMQHDVRTLDRKLPGITATHVVYKWIDFPGELRTLWKSAKK